MRRLLLLPFLLPTAALAQDEPRYQMERTEKGYVRLDTETGEMSICREQRGELVCRPAADRSATDRRGALREEARERQPGRLRDQDHLRGEIDALERRVAALEAGRSSGVLPSDEELDRTIGFMERFFRTFMGLAREWDEESEAPNRT